MIDNKNSTDLDVGRRPKLKSDEFFVADHRSYRAYLTFVFETAEKSIAVIGGATPRTKARFRPELKSDEFFVWNPIVIEIWPLLAALFTNTYGTLWEPGTPGQ